MSAYLTRIPDERINFNGNVNAPLSSSEDIVCALILIPL